MPANEVDSKVVIGNDLLHVIIRTAKSMATLLLAATCLCQSAPSLHHKASYRQTGSKAQDAGEKITQCLAALPETGGVCDARNLAGDQYSASGFTVGGASKPMQLMLGATTLIVTKPIILQARSSITGLPPASGIGCYQGASVIKANAGASLPAVVQVEGRACRAAGRDH